MLYPTSSLPQDRGQFPFSPFRTYIYILPQLQAETPFALSPISLSFFSYLIGFNIGNLYFIFISEMELQLGLTLSTPNMIKGFDLNNLGFDQRKEMEGLEAWNHAGGCFGDKDCVKNKRGFEQAFGNFTEECKAIPLLLWSGQPNEEEDHKDQKKRTSSTIDDRNDAEEDQVVGWPPIKSWRKKTFHQHQVGRIETNQTVEKDNGRSIYVKVKMEGVPIARKIDIRLFHSYQALTNSLISMFAKNQKCDEDDYTRYTLTYQDKEGDWLIAGDIPWQTFIRSVQRLEIVRNSS